jgi:excisionase family DNA binding protein
MVQLEQLTVKQVAERFNLRASHVRKFVAKGELMATKDGRGRLTFSSSNVEVFAEKLREKRIESLRKIAQACEELGFYDDD